MHINRCLNAHSRPYITQCLTELGPPYIFGALLHWAIHVSLSLGALLHCKIPTLYIMLVHYCTELPICYLVHIPLSHPHSHAYVTWCITTQSHIYVSWCILHWAIHMSLGALLHWAIHMSLGTVIYWAIHMSFDAILNCISLCVDIVCPVKS